MQWRQQEPDDRRAGAGGCFDQLRREAKSDDAHKHAPDTRLTNGFSKKIENLEHAVSLHFMHYNFGRVHKTLRVTPAMAADVTEHAWGLEEIAQRAD